MKHIRWTPAAAADLEVIVRHIRRDNIEAARQIAVQIMQSLEKLQTFPSMGRVGQKTNTREWAVPPYVIVYRVGQTS